MRALLLAADALAADGNDPIWPTNQLKFSARPGAAFAALGIAPGILAVAKLFQNLLSEVGLD